jgi:putative tryptophan/tyrosine transport system substrate-binding protein
VRLLVILVLGLLAVPLAAAQSIPKPLRIGALAGTTASTLAGRLDSFRQGLRELGYVEGQNIVIEYRYAEGKLERLPELAAELVSLNVHVIFAVAAPETGAAKRATTSIPIVFAGHGDPVGTGHVASLAKPGGNITGMSQMLPELSAKRLEVLKEAFPRVSRVAVLWNAKNPTKMLDWREAQRAAPALGIALQSREVRGPDDFASAFTALTKQRPDALMTLDDPVTLTARTAIVEFAAKERLPTIYALSDFVYAGGLISYGPNRAEMYRRAGIYVGLILKGAKPADLPVAQATKFELVINLKTAKALGVTIPASILSRADEVLPP